VDRRAESRERREGVEVEEGSEDIVCVVPAVPRPPAGQMVAVLFPTAGQ
jgi:hypothetical protein